MNIGNLIDKIRSDVTKFPDKHLEYETDFLPQEEIIILMSFFSENNIPAVIAPWSEPNELEQLKVMIFIN